MGIRFSPANYSTAFTGPHTGTRYPCSRRTENNSPVEITSRLIQIIDPRTIVSCKSTPRTQCAGTAFRHPPPGGAGIERGLFRILPKRAVLRGGPVFRVHVREIEGAAGVVTASRSTASTRGCCQALVSVNEKVVPTSGILRTVTVSLWASRICLTMASPSPVPPAARERLLSTR